MNANRECGVCYSCRLPGPEVVQLVLFDTAALMEPSVQCMLHNVHVLQRSAPPSRVPLPADDVCDRAASAPVHMPHYRAWTNLSRAQTSGATITACEGLIGFRSDQILWALPRWDLQFGVARYSFFCWDGAHMVSCASTTLFGLQQDPLACQG